MDVESTKIGVDVNISWGNSYNISNKPWVTNPPDARDNLVYSGTAAPTSTPRMLGDMYIRTSNKKIYVSTGTTAYTDRTIIN